MNNKTRVLVTGRGEFIISRLVKCLKFVHIATRACNSECAG